MTNPPTPKKSCFVIMPITDVPPYEAGHFKRVYEYIIKPACLKSGFAPVRADEVERANHIILDVLRRVLEADVVLCDLSSRNANVLYELGVRQAFNKPVVLIKDNQTERIFDIQGLRDIEYDAALRVDKTTPAINAIAASITNTTDGDQGEVNSLIQLLGVHAATIPQRTEVSGETGLILNFLSEIASRMTTLENLAGAGPGGTASVVQAQERQLLYYEGDEILHEELGKGRVTRARDKSGHVLVTFADGKTRRLREDDPAMQDDLPF
jgi:hypothetical protein